MRINILETGEIEGFNMKVYIRPRASSFIDAIPPPPLPSPFPFCFEVSFVGELRYSNGETEKTGHSFIKLFDIASVKEEEWRIDGAQRDRSGKDIGNNLRHSTSVKRMEIFLRRRRDFFSVSLFVASAERFFEKYNFSKMAVAVHGGHYR